MAQQLTAAGSTTKHGAMSTLRFAASILMWSVIGIATLWCIFPFYWAITTSFKNRSDIVTKPTLIPWLHFTPTLFNWQSEFGQRWPEISKALTNSLIIAIGAAVIAVDHLGTLAGYGLARYPLLQDGATAV